MSKPSERGRELARELYPKTSIELPDGCGPDDDIDFGAIAEALTAARAEGMAQGRREAIEECATWRPITREEYKALPTRTKWHVPYDRGARRVVLWNYRTGEPVAVLEVPTIPALAEPPTAEEKPASVKAIKKPEPGENGNFGYPPAAGYD